MNLPTIIFTTFWQANKIIEDKGCSLSRDGKIFYLKLVKNCYFVNSISLSCPDINKLKWIFEFQKKSLFKLGFLCPQYEMLAEYKKNKDWNLFEKKYINLINKRKEEITNWLFSLKNDSVYFLCCWENTSGKANCHRKTLYDIFNKSKKMNDKFNLFYMHGDYKEHDIENVIQAGRDGYISFVTNQSAQFITNQSVQYRFNNN